MANLWSTWSLRVIDLSHVDHNVRNTTRNPNWDVRRGRLVDCIYGLCWALEVLPFMHQEIFACFKFRWTGTMRKYFFCLHYGWSWTQIREHKKQHYIYKQLHGSVEIRSLYHVLTAWGYSAFTSDRMVLLKFKSLYRMSMLRALLASQHETRSVQNSGQQRRSNSEGTPKDVSCFQGENSTFNNHQWSSWWSQGNVTTACDQHQL